MIIDYLCRFILNLDLNMKKLGILLLFPALYLIIHKKDGGRVALKWLFYALLSALLSGTTAILQKTHQLSVYAKELPIFSHSPPPFIKAIGEIPR